MDNTNDLTEGRVSAKLLGFFFPMLLTNLLQQIYSVADTAIVGKGLGDGALAAVGNLSSLSLFLIGSSMGMTNGFSVIIAQNHGAGRKEDVKRSVALSVKLCTIMSAVLTIAGCVLLHPVLSAMDTDVTILSDSLLYGCIIFGGTAVTVAYNMCSGILRSLGDSKTPFNAIIISSAMNIALDMILIFIVHTGVEGAAAATVFSQGLSAAICLIKLRKIPAVKLERRHFAKDADMTAALLKNGLPMALMNSVTALGCMVVQRYVNSCGAGYTSAYSVCSKYLNLFMLPSLTAGFALSSFVSQNFGAGKAKRIRQGVRVGTGIAVVSYLILGAVMVFMSGALAGMMLNEGGTIVLAGQYLKVCGCALILLDLLFIFRSAVQGMGYPLIPMLSGIAEMALRIPVIILLLPSVGLSAAAYADCIAWIGALSLNIGAYLYHIRKA